MTPDMSNWSPLRRNAYMDAVVAERQRNPKKCFMCGRFVPRVPEGWEVCQHPENDDVQYQDYEKYEYKIQVHDCPIESGSAAQRLIKRPREEKVE